MPFNFAVAIQWWWIAVPIFTVIVLTAIGIFARRRYVRVCDVCLELNSFV